MEDSCVSNRCQSYLVMVFVIQSFSFLLVQVYSLPGVEIEMQEDCLWSLRPLQDIDKVLLLTNRYGGANNETLSLLYCDLYLRRYKETLKQTTLEQESVFEDQVSFLHSTNAL